MILLIDIGNSSICFGLHDSKTLVNTYRIKSFLDKSSDEYYLIFKNFIDSKIDDIIISSVVPQITSAIRKMAIQYFKIEPKIIGQSLKTGVKIIADDPKTVGADLICDVAGASMYFDEGLIIDLGTVSKILYFKNNTFMSCLIAPGISTSTKAMISKAALLPNFELVVPKKVLNNSTIPCMQSGVIYGFASMVDGLIKKIKNELNNPSLKIIATGGLVSLIAPLCEEKFDIIENNLILLGLYKIYLKNI
jgi:type III pantothenate kinase